MAKNIAKRISSDGGSALIIDYGQYGRRPLLMIAVGGMCISCFIIGSFYIQGHFDGSSLLLLARKLSLIGILGYMATFSMGMGGIPWVMMSEIFPLNMKRIAGSLVSLTAWFGSWIVTLTFNSLFSWSSTASFFIFLHMAFLRFISSHSVASKDRI